jgi:hypothetical protein
MQYLHAGFPLPSDRSAAPLRTPGGGLSRIERKYLYEKLDPVNAAFFCPASCLELCCTGAACMCMHVLVRRLTWPLAVQDIEISPSGFPEPLSTPTRTSERSAHQFQLSTNLYLRQPAHNVSSTLEGIMHACMCC